MPRTSCRTRFLKAYQKLDQFQGNSKFYTWLVRIAVNESLMRLRKRRTGQNGFDRTRIWKPRKAPFPATWPTGRPTRSRTTRNPNWDRSSRRPSRAPPGFKVVFELRDVQGLFHRGHGRGAWPQYSGRQSRLLRARLQTARAPQPLLSQETRVKTCRPQSCEG